MVKVIVVMALLSAGIVGGVFTVLDRETDPFTGEQQSTWERLEQAVEDVTDGDPF